MSNKKYLALLAGASFLGAGLHPALANEAEFVSEPIVIYADQPAQRPVAPIRTASAERPNMGGGFIEFLFGDGQIKAIALPGNPTISSSRHTRRSVRCCRRWSRSKPCASRN